MQKYSSNTWKSITITSLASHINYVDFQFCPFATICKLQNWSIITNLNIKLQHHQLETLFKVCISYDFHSNSRIPMMTYTPDRDDTCHDKKSTIEIFFRTYWRRAWIVTLWLIICFALFAWKFTQYSHRKAFEVMGYCLCTAKGAAETLKFNMALILLPVCRNTMTWLRMNNSINSVVPFNDNINFHKVI